MRSEQDENTLHGQTCCHTYRRALVVPSSTTWAALSAYACDFLCVVAVVAAPNMRAATATTQSNATLFIVPQFL